MRGLQAARSRHTDVAPESRGQRCVQHRAAHRARGAQLTRAAVRQTTRDYFEPRLAHDLSGVHVHVDANASVSAQAISSLAYTVGRNVMFGPGALHAPETPQGQRLLAHELVHFIQQDSGRFSATPLRESRLQRQTAACVPTNRKQRTSSIDSFQDDYVTTLNPTDGANEIAIPAATPKGLSVGYADLVDQKNFQLFEIKSIHPAEMARGYAEVALYEIAAKRHCDKRWRAGTTSYPTFRDYYEGGAKPGRGSLLRTDRTRLDRLCMVAGGSGRRARRCICSSETGSEERQCHPIRNRFDACGRPAVILTALTKMAATAASGRLLLVCSLKRTRTRSESFTSPKR